MEETNVQSVEKKQDVIVCPHCNGEIVIEKTRGRKARNAGISLADMTIEQLRTEKINANSVLYKATKRGASAETIEANQARVDAVKAEIASRKPVEVVPDTTEAESVYVDEATPTAEY